MEIERSTGNSYFARFALECAAVSVKSPDRHRNEDRFVFMAPGLPVAEQVRAGYLFAVLDGVSLGGRGAFAAQVAADVLREVLTDARAVEGRPHLLVTAFVAANELARREGGQCAATTAWLWEESATVTVPRMAWSHVGDTRLYHRCRGKWSRLTEDHARGRSLTRSIGDPPAGFRADTGAIDLFAGDWIVLVTDGVWKHACPLTAGILDDCETSVDACSRLLTQAWMNGSRDDRTAVVVRVGRKSELEE